MRQDSPYIKNQCLGFLMKKAFQCIVGQADKALEPFDLTYAQWLVVDQLHTSGSKGLLNLAKALELDPGALTRTLERLEIKGLVKRVRTLQDKRTCQIELTHKSQAMMGTVPNILADVMNQHLQGLGPQEHNKLIHALNHVIKNANELKVHSPHMAAVHDSQLETQFLPT